MSAISLHNAPTYERIYAIVGQIPPGRVATYGQVAALVGSCTARMVGYAMAALPADSGVPWQRVINRQGKISPRGGGDSALHQRELLEAEGVQFDEAGQVDFAQVGWSGPDWEWLELNGFYPASPPWLMGSL
jgi:methylated-DNA-protein-cysteine methyltransferase-like protein